MSKKTLSSQIEALLDSLDSQEDVAQATQLLHKRFFEKSLNAELDEHLGYEKHALNSNSKRNVKHVCRLWTPKSFICIHRA